jgi:phenylalanyl-tRNA synthetase alpha chain
VLDEADSELSTVNDLQTLQQKKANFLGKKRPIALIMATMKDLSVEAKKEMGMKSNKIKQALEAKYEEKKKQIDEAIIAKKLASETIDVTLPGVKIPVGGIYPLMKTVMDL